MLQAVPVELRRRCPVAGGEGLRRGLPDQVPRGHALPRREDAQDHDGAGHAEPGNRCAVRCQP